MNVFLSSNCPGYALLVLNRRPVVAATTTRTTPFPHARGARQCLRVPLRMRRRHTYTRSFSNLRETLLVSLNNDHTLPSPFLSRLSHNAHTHTHNGAASYRFPQRRILGQDSYKERGSVRRAAGRRRRVPGRGGCRRNSRTSWSLAQEVNKWRSARSTRYTEGCYHAY